MDSRGDAPRVVRGQHEGQWAAGPEIPAGALVAQRVLQAAARTPHALALVARACGLTYGELSELAQRLARRLRGAGIARESIVAIAAEPGPQMVVAQLATWLAGGAFLPLDPSYPRARLAFMLEDAGAKLLLDAVGLGLPALEGAGEGSRGPWGWSMERALCPLSEEEDRTLPTQWKEAEGQDLAYLLYTSGSTGRPKGVLVEHAALLNYVRWDIDAFGLASHDRVSQTIAPSFDMSMWEIWPTLVAGASLHFADRADYARPGALLRWLAEERITVSVLATPLAEQLLTEPLPERLDLRCLLVAGDRLRSFAGKGRPFALFNLYGPTEATITVTCGRVPEQAPEPLALPSIGRPAAGAELYVLDELGRSVPPGVPGELYIGGPGLARGYHNLPEQTRARFVEDVRPGQRLYRTGDRVCMTDSGELSFLSRIDQQVKLRGHRIELGEIEVALSAHPAVRSAVVLLEDERLCAYLQPHPRRALPDAAELTGHLQETLPAYMVPSTWTLVAQLPLTPNGKIDRDALRACRVPEHAEGAVEDSGASGDHFQERMARLWCEVLAVREVTEQADFFGLGGHSLSGLELTARIGREFSIPAGLSDLIAAPTFGAFCRRLAARQPDEASPGDRAGAGEAALADPAQPFPLTDVQHAYWIGRQSVLPLGDVATHLYFEREGRLELARLEDALNRVIRQHGMLRAVVREDGSQQVLAEVPRYAIRVYDHAHTGDRERAHHLASVRQELSHQVLQADRWPLFDIRATSLPGGLVRLHLSFDALIVDAQSLFKLLDEWHRLYVDPGRDLLPVRRTFADYVWALERQKSSQAYARAKEYWRARLDALPGEPELPLRPTSQKATHTRFARRTTTLCGERWRRLRSRAHAHRLTETVALLCAYADVLAAFAKSPRFLLNLTLFDRRALIEDVELLVGDFTSVSLLEVDARAASCFRERAAKIQARLFQDLDHRAYSGVQVLRDCASGRGRISAPVVFTSELGLDALGRDTSVLDRFGREVDAITQTPQVWIDLQVVEQRGELVAYWDAVEELFCPGVLDAMFEAFREKVVALADRPESWEAEPWVRASDVGRVPYEAPPPRARALHEGFLDSASRTPDELAVVQGGSRVRYGELLTRARAIAGALGALEASTLVGVELPKSPVQVAAVLGVLLSGAAYVPLDPSWPLARRQTLLREAEIGTLLTTRDRADDHAASPDLRVIMADSIAGDGAAIGEDVIDPRRLAYVIFTSGSTGVPKGVMVTHQAAWNTIADVQERMALTAHDRVLGLSALSFDLSVFDIFGTLSAGGTLVLPEPGHIRDPEHLRECVAVEQVTWWSSVPALAELLIDGSLPDTVEQLRSLRTMLLSGDWIAVDLPARIWRLCPEAALYSLGGATEAAIWSIVHRIARDAPSDWSSVPYGRAMHGQKVAVLDAQFARSPPWVAGEICIGGVGLAEGYLGDAERTARAFVVDPHTGERWYRTGDIGRYRPDGLIELLGREDNQVKINGFRIELGEVEAALRAHAGVQRCAVVVAGARGKRRMVAAVVPRGQLNPAELREHLRNRLPDYMLPSRLVTLDRLPTTANGKLDPRAIVRLCEAPRPAKDTAADESTCAVARAWAEVLERPSEEIDLDLNFFDAGGDSVTAIRLRSRLQLVPAVGALPLTFVFEHSTIRAQARLLAEGTGRGQEQGMSPAQRAQRRRAAQRVV